MNNQTDLREVTVSVLNQLRSFLPDKTFFIKRRSFEELAVVGFVHGSIEPEQTFFTVENDGKLIYVNTQLPEEECLLTFQASASTCIELNLEDSLQELIKQQENFAQDNEISYA